MVFAIWDINPWREVILHLTIWYPYIRETLPGCTQSLCTMIFHRRSGQAITWTDAYVLSIGPLRTNFSKIRITIQNFSFMKMHLKCRLRKFFRYVVQMGWFKVGSCTVSFAQNFFLSRWIFHKFCTDSVKIQRLVYQWWRHQIESFSRHWPFVREFTGHRWIPYTKVSDAELWCFLWFALE